MCNMIQNSFESLDSRNLISYFDGILCNFICLDVMLTMSSYSQKIDKCPILIVSVHISFVFDR